MTRFCCHSVNFIKKPSPSPTVPFSKRRPGMAASCLGKVCLNHARIAGPVLECSKSRTINSGAIVPHQFYHFIKILNFLKPGTGFLSFQVPMARPSAFPFGVITVCGIVIILRIFPPFYHCAFLSHPFSTASTWPVSSDSLCLLGQRPKSQSVFQFLDLSLTVFQHSVPRTKGLTVWLRLCRHMSTYGQDMETGLCTGPHYIPCLFNSAFSQVPQSARHVRPLQNPFCHPFDSASAIGQTLNGLATITESSV